MPRYQVKLDRLEDGVPTDAVSIEIDERGMARLRRPDCFRGLGPKQIRQLILDVVALKAASGSLEAARLWLAESRWTDEMRKGKAPIRGRVESHLTVQVVDDLSRSVAGLATGDATRQLPAGEDARPASEK